MIFQGNKNADKNICATIGLVLVLLFNTGAFAQQTRDTASILRFGANGHYVLPLHSYAFRGLQNVPTCCPKVFESVVSSAFDVGIFGELPLLQNASNLSNPTQMSLGVNIRFTQLTANFRYLETSVVSGGNVPFPISIQHLLQTSVGWLGVEPYFVLRPLEALSLMAGVGVQIPLVSSFRQAERLLSDSLLFSGTGTTTRNVMEGSPIPGITAILPNVSIGARYEIPLSESGRFSLAPEVLLSVPIGNLVQNLQAPNNGVGTWSMLALRGGLAFIIAPERHSVILPVETKISEQPIPPIAQTQESKRVEPKRVVDTVAPNIVSERKPDSSRTTIAMKPLRAVITSIQGIQENGVVTENPTLRVVETLASRSRYVLNNVFFAENAVMLDKRYERLQTEQLGNFYLEDLVDLDVLQIYYHVLNIIGQRMATHPKAVLTLTGFADGLNEKNNKNLATKRAEEVLRYFREVWDIAPNRLKLKTGISRTPTGTNGDELLEAEEQRRVELQCDVPAVLEELRFEYKLRDVQPPKLLINARVESIAPVRNVKLTATQLQTEGNWMEQERVLFRKEYPESASNLASNLTSNLAPAKPVQQEISELWDVAASKVMPESRETLKIRLLAEATDGSKADTSLGVPVNLLSVEDKMRQKLPDERVDTYTLFSFAYGTNAPLSGNAEAVRIVQQIKQTLKPGAKVIIRGYSDVRGNPATNQELSKQRAQSVANLINFSGADVQGVGVTNLSDNRLPEGRFYNRFVQVDVRTPLQ